MKKTERIVGDVVIDLLRKYPSQSSKHLAEIYQDDDYFKVDNKGIINYRIV